MKLLILFALSFTAGAQYSIDSVIDTLIRVESSGDNEAKGDYKNGEYRAIGALQIWKVQVDDVNRICKLKGYPYVFTYQHRFIRERSVLMTRISLINCIERYKINKGRLPNEYELAHWHKWPYKYGIHDFKYINQYKTKKEI